MTAGACFVSAACTAKSPGPARGASAAAVNGVKASLASTTRQRVSGRLLHRGVEAGDRAPPLHNAVLKLG